MAPAKYVKADLAAIELSKSLVNSISKSLYTSAISSNLEQKDVFKSSHCAIYSRQVEYKKILFNTINEKDVGQDTLNPYILAKRYFYSSKVDIDLDLLNKILAFNNINITSDEFDIVKNLVSFPVPLPVPAGDDKIISIIGNTRRGSTRVAGCYVFTFIEDSRQYVGGSKNLAKRIRYYYGSKGLLETRTIAQLMTQHGPSAFTLKVYPFTHNTPYISKQPFNNLVLRLEQYLILKVKPSLNNILVVGGVSTSMSGSLALQELAEKNMKPVYVYNVDTTKLVYKSKSRKQLWNDAGINETTVTRRLLDGKPLYNTYIFSNELLDTITVSLISSSQLRESIAILYKNRIRLRNYSSKVTSNMHPIFVTDLLSSVKERKFFVSKSQAQQYCVNIKRSFNVKLLSGKLPFTANGWIVESG